MDCSPLMLIEISKQIAFLSIYQLKQKEDSYLTFKDIK